MAFASCILLSPQRRRICRLWSTLRILHKSKPSLAPWLVSALCRSKLANCQQHPPHHWHHHHHHQLIIFPFPSLPCSIVHFILMKRWTWPRTYHGHVSTLSLVILFHLWLFCSSSPSWPSPPPAPLAETSSSLAESQTDVSRFHALIAAAAVKIRTRY